MCIYIYIYTIVWDSSHGTYSQSQCWEGISVSFFSQWEFKQKPLEKFFHTPTWKFLQKKTPLRNGWSKIWNHLCVCHFIVCQSCQSHPLIVSMGRMKEKGWQMIWISVSPKTHPSKIWSGYMSTIRSINQTWNSSRLRSERLYARLILIKSWPWFSYSSTKYLRCWERMTQKPTKYEHWCKKMLSVSSLGGSQHDSFFEG